MRLHSASASHFLREKGSKSLGGEEEIFIGRGNERLTIDNDL